MYLVLDIVSAFLWPEWSSLYAVSNSIGNYSRWLESEKPLVLEKFPLPATKPITVVSCYRAMCLPLKAREFECNNAISCEQTDGQIFKWGRTSETGELVPGIRRSILIHWYYYFNFELMFAFVNRSSHARRHDHVHISIQGGSWKQTSAQIVVSGQFYLLHIY